MYIAGRANYAHDPVELIVSYFNTRIDENPNVIILCEAHSRGLVDVINSVKQLTPERRSNIYLLAVSPGQFADKELFGNVVHLVSRGDIIPYLDPVGMIKNYDTIEFLRPIDSCFPLDHSFTSKTFDKRKHAHHKRLYKNE